MRRQSTLVLTLILLASMAAAQPDPQTPDGENLGTPASWQVRTDKPQPDVVIGSDKETADIWFVNMTPGWHITTGPRAIFWHPESVADGEYTLGTTIHLFDPEGRNEAFGLFFGGSDLAGDGVEYDYFLIRNSGDVLIKGRRAGETVTIRDWTPHDAVVRFTEASEGAVENRLEMAVTGEVVSFSINGQTVVELPRSDLRTDGLVGLRVNHRLNLHVSDLTVTQD